MTGGKEDTKLWIKNRTNKGRDPERLVFKENGETLACEIRGTEVSRSGEYWHVPTNGSQEERLTCEFGGTRQLAEGRGIAFGRSECWQPESVDHRRSCREIATEIARGIEWGRERRHVSRLRTVAACREKIGFLGFPIYIYINFAVHVSKSWY